MVRGSCSTVAPPGGLGAGPSGAARARTTATGPRVQGPRCRRVRGCADAVAPVGPARLDGAVVRLRRRALGRQGAPRSCSRARRYRCRGAASLRWHATPPFQRMLGGPERPGPRGRARRGGGAFDHGIARLVADEAGEILALEPGASTWKAGCSHVSRERRSSRWWVRRSMGRWERWVTSRTSPRRISWVTPQAVSRLARLVGARSLQLPDPEVVTIRRAGLVHDMGRGYRSGSGITRGR